MFFTVQETVEVQQKILGSAFITTLFPIQTQTDFESFLSASRKKHFKANHHGQAYRIGPEPLQEFSSDDGEPSGSTGLPILNMLKSAQLINVGAVVIRYFGGTKLGIRGLIDAYSSSVQQAIEASELLSMEERVVFDIQFPYEQQSAINTIFHPLPIHIEETEYMEKVKLRISIASHEIMKLEDALNSLEHLNVQSKSIGKHLLPIKTH